MKVVRHERYILTNVGNNNNKFWYFWLYENGDAKFHWGRVGDNGQQKTKPGVGERFVNTKIRGKLKKGYKKMDVVESVETGCEKVIAKNQLQDVAVKQIGSDCKDTVDLIKYLTKVNIHQILQATTMTYDDSTGLFSTPCGIVTRTTLDEAEKLLITIGNFIMKKDFDSDKIKNLTSEYLMLIPQKTSRRLKVTDVFPDIKSIQSQKQIIDNLDASLKECLKPKKKTKSKKEPEPEKVFQVKLKLVSDGKIIDFVNTMYRKTKNKMHSCHHLSPQKVYSVEIKSMSDAFETGKKIGNIKKLWHGTRAANLLSILRGGLIIPPSGARHVTGRMFGDGLYFSDQSTKSLNYAYGYWGGKRDNQCFMFIADVAMGKEYIPTSSGWRDKYPKAGTNSTFAKANKSGVRNNEMIVYNTNQVNLIYLIQFG